jgi:ubiquinone/menaquinone biosynthesis C-methylase UbiE
MGRVRRSVTTQYDQVGAQFFRAQRAAPVRAHRQAFRARLRESLAGKRLLDAGCGYGHDLAYFARRKAMVYGIDPSAAMITVACRLNPTITSLSIQPVQRTNFRNGFFDVVVSIYALHNAPNLRQVFRELHRILKPGGLLLYVVQHPLFIFQARKTKRYHARETYSFTIPDMATPCTIRQPAHTFSEYFNTDVLDRFEVLDFAEGREAVPMWLLVKLRKR